VPEVADTVTHAADDEIVQAQLDDVVTVIVLVPPLGFAVTRAGVTAKLHDGLGSVTTKLEPAIVRVAVRGPVVVFAAAVKLTVPVPVRPLPFEIVTQLAPLVALHVQPALVVSVTTPLPPVAASARLPGAIAYEHEAAGWSTVNV
jgi:hypothetical protein